MARTDPQVNFRIPAELKDKLEEAAHTNNRTITAELILRLEQTFNKNKELEEAKYTLSVVCEEVDDLMRRVERLEAQTGHL